MKKVKLRLNDLEVDSFEVLPVGVVNSKTVQAHLEAESDTLNYTECADPGCTPATLSQCGTCDPSYCDTQCPGCRWEDLYTVTGDVSYCNTRCPNCQNEM